MKHEVMLKFLYPTSQAHAGSQCPFTQGTISFSVMVSLQATPLIHAFYSQDFQLMAHHSCFVIYSTL